MVGKSKSSAARQQSMDMDELLLLKEGALEKNSGLFRRWRSRYFVLYENALLYFVKEEQKQSTKPRRQILLSDISSVERSEKKKKPFCIVVDTIGKKYLLNCGSYNEREEWIIKILDGKAKTTEQSTDSDKPVRRVVTGITKDFKRITIKKDPQYGIGCTIKNVGGAIFVSRIIADGPVATSGVLRPGDQIIDINGTKVSHTPIEKIKDVIRNSPDYVVCTVKPVTHYKGHDDSPQLTRTAYTTLDPEKLQEAQSSGEVNPTSYTTVNIVSHRADSEIEEDNRQSTISADYHQGYVSSEHEGEEGGDQARSDGAEHRKGPTTSYAQLEFGKRK